MDHKEFEEELSALNATRPPVSVSKISNLTSLAIRNSAGGAEIAKCIERFIKEANPNMRLSGLYVIDSISRAAFKHPEEGGAPYLSLFEGMIEDLIPYLKQVPQADEERVKRTFMLWKKTGIFSPDLMCRIKAVFFSDVKGEETCAPSKSLSPKEEKKAKEEIPISVLSEQAIEEFRSKEERTEEQLGQVLITYSERLDSSQYPNPLQALLDYIEHNASLKEAAENVSSGVLAATRKHLGLVNGSVIDSSAVSQSVQKSRNRKPHTAAQCAPMVVAAAVPFGKKQQTPRLNPQEQHHQGFEQQSQHRDSDYPQLRYQNAWNASRNQPYLQHPGRSIPDSSRRIKPLSPVDDDIQGRPIPVFDSERGAEKSSSHVQQQVPPSVAKSQRPGDCMQGYVDPYLPKRCFKVLTRTVYIGGIMHTITKEQLRNLFEAIARVDTVTVNYPKFNAFVKFLTRAEAELAKEYFQDFHWKGTVLKMGWGCGYGPKEYFDYNSGETIFPISRMTDTEKRIISCSSRGGGPIVGGMVVEEPDFGWPQKGDVCHGEYARGQVPHAPGYLQALAQREWFKSQSIPGEFSLNKLSTLKDRIPRVLLQDQTTTFKSDVAMRAPKDKFPAAATASPPDSSTQMPIPIISSEVQASNGIAPQDRLPAVTGHRNQPQSRKRSAAHVFTVQSSATSPTSASKYQKATNFASASGVSTISVVSERRYNDDNQLSTQDSSIYSASRPDSDTWPASSD